jgi:hypothetical protein
MPACIIGRNWTLALPSKKQSKGKKNVVTHERITTFEINSKWDSNKYYLYYPNYSQRTLLSSPAKQTEALP